MRLAHDFVRVADLVALALVIPWLHRFHLELLRRAVEILLLQAHLLHRIGHMLAVLCRVYFERRWVFLDRALRLGCGVTARHLLEIESGQRLRFLRVLGLCNVAANVLQIFRRALPVISESIVGLGRRLHGRLRVLQTQLLVLLNFAYLLDASLGVHRSVSAFIRHSVTRRTGGTGRRLLLLTRSSLDHAQVLAHLCMRLRR